MTVDVASPRGARVAAANDEVAAIVAALEALECESRRQAQLPPSRWRLAGRIYEADAP
jgi:hypothetical protein